MPARLLSKACLASKFVVLRPKEDYPIKFKYSFPYRISGSKAERVDRSCALPSSAHPFVGAVTDGKNVVGGFALILWSAVRDGSGEQENNELFVYCQEVGPAVDFIRLATIWLDLS
jgi:hypothetical protein